MLFSGVFFCPVGSPLHLRQRAVVSLAVAPSRRSLFQSFLFSGIQFDAIIVVLFARRSIEREHKIPLFRVPFSLPLTCRSLCANICLRQLQYHPASEPVVVATLATSSGRFKKAVALIKRAQYFEWLSNWDGGWAECLFIFIVNLNSNKLRPLRQTPSAPGEIGLLLRPPFPQRARGAYAVSFRLGAGTIGQPPCPTRT